MAYGKKSQAEQIAIVERREQALQLRRSGLPIREIAKRLNVSPATIHSDIKAMLKAAIAENTKSADYLRALELDRLDRMFLHLAPLVYPAHPKQPDMKAVERALRISEQRAKLLGLYAPVKTEHSGKIELTWQDEAVSMIQRGELDKETALQVFDNNDELVSALFAKAAVSVSTGTAEE